MLIVGLAIASWLLLAVLVVALCAAAHDGDIAMAKQRAYLVDRMREAAERSREASRPRRVA